MVQRIRLHGGPWHGRTVELQDGRDHLHVVVPFGLPQALDSERATQPEIEKREGTYSRAHGSLHNYEWDGYRSHD